MAKKDKKRSQSVPALKKGSAYMNALEKVLKSNLPTAKELQAKTKKVKADFASLQNL